MTVKHTPGPWAIYVPKSLSNDDMAYGIDTDKDTESESVVLFYGGILKKEDACLIAAAPDLLDALETIIKWNRDHAEAQYGDPNKCETWACVVKARAAIAKATYKEP